MRGATEKRTDSKPFSCYLYLHIWLYEELFVLFICISIAAALDSRLMIFLHANSVECRTITINSENPY